MQTPRVIRLLAADERSTLEKGLRSFETFTARRCHILPVSAEGQRTTTMAQTLRCHAQLDEGRHGAQTARVGAAQGRSRPEK
jgi:hypothetical protein